MSKTTLLIGASTNQSRFSYKAARKLIQYGHKVFLISKKKGDIEGVELQKDFPEDTEIDTVTLYINPALQKEYYMKLIQLKPRRIIFNPGTENSELKNLCKLNHIEVVEDCTLVMLSAEIY